MGAKSHHSSSEGATIGSFQSGLSLSMFRRVCSGRMGEAVESVQGGFWQMKSGLPNTVCRSRCAACDHISDLGECRTALGMEDWVRQRRRMSCGARGSSVIETLVEETTSDVAIIRDGT